MLVVGPQIYATRQRGIEQPAFVTGDSVPRNRFGLCRGRRPWRHRPSRRHVQYDVRNAPSPPPHNRLGGQVVKKRQTSFHGYRRYQDSASSHADTLRLNNRRRPSGIR